MKHLKSIVVAAAMLLATAVSSAQDAPKREFRGAWMHIIGQGQYARMTPGETQDYLRDQLSQLENGECLDIFDKLHCLFGSHDNSPFQK